MPIADPWSVMLFRTSFAVALGLFGMAACTGNSASESTDGHDSEGASSGGSAAGSSSGQPGFGSDSGATSSDPTSGGASDSSSDVSGSDSGPPPDGPPGSGLLADCGASALAELADSLEPGQWAELPTEGLGAELTSVGGHHIFQFTYKAMWDPNTCQVVFIGGGHLTETRYVTYAASENRWAVVTDPPFFCPPTDGGGDVDWNCVDHAYGWNAIDQQQGVFYYYRSGRVYRSELDAELGGGWTESPEPPVPIDYSSIAYHQGLGGVVLVSADALYVWPDGAGSWQTIDGPFAMGGYHWYGAANPVNDVMLFGSGNDSPLLHRLSADGSTAPAATPSKQFHPEADASGFKILIADPLYGDYLAYSVDGSYSAYDVEDDNWTDYDPSERSLPPGMMVASSVTSYGVVMLFNLDSVYLYKHVP